MGIDQSGLPMYRKGDSYDQSKLGTGTGTDVKIEFTSQDYLKTLSLPGGRPDEVLLHELFHSLRMAVGFNLCLFMRDGYDTIEEFYSILVTNTYRSECGYSILRANHNGKTPLVDANDISFYTKYRQEVDALTSQMNSICFTIRAVNCRFNPIRRALNH